MKVLQRLRIWRELKRLEARAKELPSPTTFVDLGQVYINMARVNEALRVAEEGLVLFPASEELRKLRKFAKNGKINSRIKELRARLNRSPKVDCYRELAGLFLELGDYGAVYGTCEEGIRRHGADPELNRLLAKARLASFYRDLKSHDGLEAVAALERVLEAEPEDLKSRRSLAELLYRIGAIAPALAQVERLKKAAPRDSEIRTLHDAVTHSPTCDESLEILFHHVESVAALAHGPIVRERAPAPSVPETTLSSVRDALAQVAEIGGVRKAAYIRGTKALVKGDIRSGRDAFLRVVRVVTKAAQRASRRLEMGSFSKGVVEGDFGQVCICSYGEVTAAVLCDPGTIVDRVLAELQELVAGSLYFEEAQNP